MLLSGMQMRNSRGGCEDIRTPPFLCCGGKGQKTSRFSGF